MAHQGVFAMLSRIALNRKSCTGFAFVILTIALAVGFTACSFDSSALGRLEDDVIIIGGGDADAFEPDGVFTDAQDAHPDIATDAGLDAEVRDTSDIDTTVAPDAPADTLGDTELDSDVTSDTRDASADISDAMDAEAEVFDTVDAEVEVDEGCERDRDCGWGQICWMGECLDNQACNPFAVKAVSGTWLTWYPATGPSVRERASGVTVWDESPPGACSVAVEAPSCQCLTHLGASSCDTLPGGGFGCVHNDDHLR